MSVSAPCTLLTSGIFSNLASSSADPLYSYVGLCGTGGADGAIYEWNVANTNNQIFMGLTELDRKNELAAFLGHTLHESGDYEHPRETSQCGTTATADGTTPAGFPSGTIFCQDYTSGGAYADPYCSSEHTSSSNPGGCDCSAVPETGSAGYEANKLFFGRGPIQLSWNYNYKAASDALGGGLDLCSTPDLVATDPLVAWKTAIWFWMSSTGSTGTTPHAAVTDDGSFGGSLNTINGGLECTTSDTNKDKIVTRLNKYCGAAKELGVGLLGFDGCTDLQEVYDSCISGGAGTWGACTNCDGISSSPTASPTSAPTSSPTVSPPTGSPTVSPTHAPSGSPTSAPTGSPTKAPTLIVESPGTIIVSPADCAATIDYTAMTTDIETTACASANADSDTVSCSVEPITADDVTCVSGRRLRNPLSRQLAVDPDAELRIKFKVIIETVCLYSQCDNSATGVTARGDEIYDMVKGDLTQSDIDTIVLALIASQAAIPAGATGTAVLDAVVVPLLETLSKYFPDWHGGSGTCLNDNTMPLYMRITGSYLEETLKACCERFYGWAVQECMGDDNYDLTGFYPGWETTDVKCLDASTENPPKYMQNNPTAWLIDDVEECCERYYSWDLNTCLVESGATTAADLYSGDWYVSDDYKKCVKDCAVTTSDPQCGGKNPSWEPLYDSAADCCEGKLWWIEARTCEAASTGGTVAADTGTGDWYVDWSLNPNQCVKDCATSSSDPECGGLREAGDSELYSSAGDCCDRISSWVDREDCTP